MALEFGKAKEGNWELMCAALTSKPTVGGLKNKLDPFKTTNILGFEEATELMEFFASRGIAGAHEPFFAMAARLGYLCEKLEEDTEITSDHLGAAVLRITGDFGDAIHSSSQAIADGVVTQRELEVTEPKLLKILRRIASLRTMFRRKARKDQRVMQAA
jgi:hypothetical protein